MSDAAPVIAAVIPALNEADSIGYVLRAIRQCGIPYVRVVDNGSTDTTAAVASALGAQVFYESRRGYGAACWRGIEGLPDEVEWILFCDADGSDDFDCLPDFLLFARNHDFILGARQHSPSGGTGVSLAQRLGNVVASACIRWGWGHRYHDMGPFRLIRRASLESLRIEDRTWGWTLEMQVRAVEERLRILEIPVRSLPRRGGRSKIGGSVIGGARASARIVFTLAKLYWRRSRRRLQHQSGVHRKVDSAVSSPSVD